MGWKLPQLLSRVELDFKGSNKSRSDATQPDEMNWVGWGAVIMTELLAAVSTHTHTHIPYPRIGMSQLRHVSHAQSEWMVRCKLLCWRIATCTTVHARFMSRRRDHQRVQAVRRLVTDLYYAFIQDFLSWDVKNGVEELSRKRGLVLCPWCGLPGPNPQKQGPGCSPRNGGLCFHEGRKTSYFSWSLSTFRTHPVESETVFGNAFCQRLFCSELVHKCFVLTMFQRNDGTTCDNGSW